MLCITVVEQSLIIKEIAIVTKEIVTKIQYSKSSKCWVSKPVRTKKQKKYLQEMMEKVVEIKLVVME